MLLEGDQWRFSLAGDIHSGSIEIMFKSKQTGSFGVSSSYRQGFELHPSVIQIKPTQLLTLL